MSENNNIKMAATVNEKIKNKNYEKNSKTSKIRIFIPFADLHQTLSVGNKNSIDIVVTKVVFGFL